MKITLNDNASKLITCVKLLTLFFLLVILFNSCKKELLMEGGQGKKNLNKGDVLIASVSYNDFLSNVGVESNSTLGRLLDVRLRTGKQLNMSSLSNVSDLDIAADSVKKLVVNDTVSYVLAIKNKTPHAITFQNLTIQKVGNITTAFLTTYTPSHTWISNWLKGHETAFQGQIKHQQVDIGNLNLSTKQTKVSKSGAAQVQSMQVCTSYLVYQVVAVPCTGTGEQKHWPGEPCQNDGGVGAPYYDIRVSVQLECENVGGGGEGGGGDTGGGGGTGDGTTTPNYPPGYNPCDETSREPSSIKGNPCDESTPTPTQAQLIVSWLGITDEQQISLLNSNNALAEQIHSYLLSNANSPDSKNFARWIVAHLTVNTVLANDVKSYLNANPTHGQIVILALKDIKNGAITWGEFETLAVLFQNQSYVPRDREPASYNWRNKLTSTDFSNYLTETTPKIIMVNGKEVKNVEAYNCHYHAFGTDSASLVDSEYPKLVYNIDLSKWKIVTSNLQVGDRVLYFLPDISRQLGQALTHSAIVIEVDSKGYATKVSSKMGTYQILEHHPRDVPNIYGVTNASYDYKGTTYPSRMYFRKK